MREALAAISAAEGGKRVLAARAPPDGVEYAADAGVEDLHHLAIDAGVAARGELARLAFALACRRLDGGSGPRPVRGGVMQAQEIGLGPGGRIGDPGGGAIAQH